MTNRPTLYGAPYNPVGLCDPSAYHTMENIPVYFQLAVEGINCRIVPLDDSAWPFGADGSSGDDCVH